MSKRKFRCLKELYAVTLEISEPKITPVPKSGNEIQGHLNQANDVVQMDMITQAPNCGYDIQGPSDQANDVIQMDMGEHSDEGSSEQVEFSLEKLDNSGAGACHYIAHVCAESFEPYKKMDSGNLSVDAINCKDQNEDFGKLKVSFEAPKLHEPYSQPGGVNKSGGSDTVEAEVQVCDICGDAGREKLLAICSKCIDGAEHIYCMQVKLDKVPDAEWMCEECRLEDNSEKQKQDDFEEAVGTSTPSLLESNSILKSNSFNAVKSIMTKVEHPVKDVLHKQKIERFFATDGFKESIIRARKSMSLNGAAEDHSNTGISKINFFSTSLSGADNLTRLQSINEQNLMQRDNSVNFNSPMISSHVVGSGVSASKMGKKVSSSVFSVPSGTNCRDLKVGPFHQTSNDLSRLTSCYSHDGSGHPNELAGFETVERLPSCSSNLVKDLYATRIYDSFHELKVNQVNIENIKGVAEATETTRDECVPELHYLWQGGFDMKRSTRLPRFSDGIQAHLSICASPKVIEVVKKLPHKVVLEEVSRLSIWPTEFLEYGATEDNIALYFFAEDVQSYEGSYKILLECMIKNDIALKGYVDGTELLIFSSNILPKKSQSWNRLSFLWGVFRERRVCIQKRNYVPNLNLVPSDHDIGCTTTSLKEQIDPESRQDSDCKPCLESSCVSDMNSITVEEESTYKKMRKYSSGYFLSRDINNSSECDSSERTAVDSSFSVNFPPQQVVSSDNESPMESRISNLELSLGPKSKMENNGGVSSSFLGMLDKKNTQDNHSNPATISNSCNNDDAVSTSLLLSLARPLSSEENVFKIVWNVK